MPSQRNLVHDLYEQLAFLQASSAGFDAGMHIEAKRLAVTIRVMVHDTANSHSLLEQLDIKTSLKWISSTRGVDPANMLTTMGLTLMRLGDAEFSYEAKDDDTIAHFANFVTFDEWWNDAVIKDSHGELFSRRDLTLALANKDGGAHIDDLQTRVRRLAHEGSLGWFLGRAPDEDADDVSLEDELITLNPILTSVRTIAGELRLTLLNQQELWNPAVAAP